MGSPEAIFASDPSVLPPPESAPQQAPALQDVLAPALGWQEALAAAGAPAVPGAASSSSAPSAGAIQTIAQEFLEVVKPNDGPASPRSRTPSVEPRGWAPTRARRWRGRGTGALFPSPGSVPRSSRWSTRSRTTPASAT
eukprot:10457258-Alexandrium_andersonii.AAC.1